jgi:hypothetical protein
MQGGIPRRQIEAAIHHNRGGGDTTGQRQSFKSLAGLGRESVKLTIGIKNQNEIVS